MKSRTEITDLGTKDIEKYLKELKSTISLINVESDKHYQDKDVDLLWVSYINKEVKCSKVEIKVDEYDNTRNFFFETISNTTKMSKGCFLLTESDYIFYYFLNTKKLYVLPMPLTREWFVTNVVQERFTTRRSPSTDVSGESYYSRGYLVKIDTVVKEVEGVRVINID